MTQRTGTEVVYRQTGDCSIELGSPKGGRVKIFLTPEEVDDPKTAIKKIESMAAILDHAKQRLGQAKK